MTEIKKIFGMKDTPIQKFVAPERQSIEQIEDYAVKRVLRVNELINEYVSTTNKNVSIFRHGTTTDAAIGYDAGNIAGEFKAYTYGTNNIKINGALGVVIENTGSNATTVSSSIFTVTSTNRGVLFPRMTSARKNTLGALPAAEGLIVYDTTLHKLCIWTGAAWETFTSI